MVHILIYLHHLLSQYTIVHLHLSYNIIAVPAVSVMSVVVSSGILVGVCFQLSPWVNHTLKLGKLQEPQVVHGDPSVQVGLRGPSRPFDQGVHRMLCQVAHADLYR